jgi:UbiD family decarboxylase
LKLVVVVDEDIDIFNEAEVLWAISTRFQADKDLDKVEGAMGVVLDPSASDEGTTTRIGMDATKPLKESAIRIQIPREAKEFAKRLVSSKSA